MKYFITLFVLLTLLVAGETTTNLKVKGMACQYSCANKVKSVLNDVDGIESCNVNFETSTATVSYDDAKITPAEIKIILSSFRSKVLIFNINWFSVVFNFRY